MFTKGRLIAGCILAFGFAFMLWAMTPKTKPASGQASNIPMMEHQNPSRKSSNDPQEMDTAENASVFRQIAFGNSDKVLEVLGEPDARWIQADRIVWYYKDRVDWSDGSPFNAAVHIVDDEVISVVNYPLEWMDDKIATARVNEGWLPPEVPSGKTLSAEEVVGLVKKGDSEQEVLGHFGQPTMKSVIRGREIWQWNEIMSYEGGTGSYIVGFSQGIVIQVGAEP